MQQNVFVSPPPLPLETAVPTRFVSAPNPRPGSWCQTLAHVAPEAGSPEAGAPPSQRVPWAGASIHRHRRGGRGRRGSVRVARPRPAQCVDLHRLGVGGAGGGGLRDGRGSARRLHLRGGGGDGRSGDAARCDSSERRISAKHPPFTKGYENAQLEVVCGTEDKSLNLNNRSPKPIL